MRDDVAFLKLASQQGGCVTREQILATGLTVRQLDRRLANREIAPVHVGVYRVAAAPKTTLQELWAAVLAAGPAAAVSRRSAAGEWRVRNVWPGQYPEVTVPTDWPLDLTGVVVHRSDHLTSPDVVQRRDGLRLTSPARTLFDIGAAVGPLVAESAYVDALQRGLVTYRKLVDVYARVGGKGRPGSAAMRMFLLGSSEGVSAIESELELRFWRVIRDFGLPVPTPQFWVVTAGGRFRVDFAYPDLKVALELNGRADHAGPLAQKRDRRRARWLRAAGWAVHDYGWTDVVGQPSQVAAQLLDIIGSATHRQGGGGTEVVGDRVAG